MVADLNVENVRKASREVRNAYFGDITSDEVLSRLGAEQAGELVILINDSRAVEQAVRVARRLAPNLSIIVRTNYLLDVEPLMAAGADDVVPAEREAAAEVTSRVLNKHRVASQSIGAHCAQIRSQRKEENGRL